MFDIKSEKPLNLAVKAVLWTVIIYLAVKYLLFVLLPLGLGWILAYFLQRPIEFLYKKLKICKSFSAAALVILTILAVGALVILAAVKLLGEVEGVAATVLGAFDSIGALWGKLITSLERFLGIEADGLRQRLPEFAMGMVEKAAAELPAVVAGFVSAIPQIVISVIVFTLSAFYLSCDFYKTNRRVLKIFDKKTSRFISEFKNQFLLTAANYLKAYMFIMLISFTQLYFGLTVLRVDYAFSVAFFIAFVDILPVLGMGVVVIPWGIWSALTGNYYLAAGLGIMFAVMSIIRQVIEPKIVGNFIGLHPLVSLLGVCVGLRFFGVMGMFLVPVLLIILQNMRKSGHISFGEESPER